MTAETELSDADLLELMNAGNEDGLTALYRRRARDIHGFALHMCGSQAMADDVTQEVFMALIRERRSYDPQKGSLHAFLLGVARNHVLRRMRVDQVLTPIGDDDDEDAGLPVSTMDLRPLDDLARAETIELVRKAVLSLPPKYREVVVLCELQDLSYEEAAEILGCAIGTVRSRLHRARALLLAKLRPVDQVDEQTSAELKSEGCFA